MSETASTSHNVEAEESIIGSVLMDGETLDFVTLQPDDFYIHRHRWIWAAMRAVRDSGLAVDYVTVTAELERRKQLQEVGGRKTLIDIMGCVPTIYHAESYAAIVRQAAANRRNIGIAQDILKQSLNGGVDVAAAIEALSQGSQGERDGRHISEGLEELERFIHERRENPVDVWGIPTGFIDLDKRTGGLHRQRVFMLTGESGTGKTTIALQIALHAAQQGHGVAIFEEEMPERDTIMRMVEMDCGVTYREIMSGSITDERLTAFQAAKQRIQNLPIYINDDPGMTTGAMRSIVTRARVRMPISLVVLDYLGLLNDEPEYGKVDYDQTKAKRFRALCKGMDLAGFTIQDMTKGGDGKTGLHRMSGGSKVRFGADEVFEIKQEEDTDNMPNTYYLVSQKERYGDMAKGFVTLTRKGLGFKNATADPVDLRSIP